MKNVYLALVALTLTAGVAAAAQSHVQAQAQRNLLQQTAATVPASCTTTYSIETGADGRSISLASVTCSRSASRMAGGAAL